MDKPKSPRELKHFTILEIGADSESPMIGTIMNVAEGQDNFSSRLMIALYEHFDAKSIRAWDIPDLFCGMHKHEITIQVDGNDYEIRIVETWMY